MADVESVWDYPRPPRLEPCRKRVIVTFADIVIADSRSSLRVLETSHPPVFYIPPTDIRMDCVFVAAGHSVCEWKGRAEYLDLHANGRVSKRAGWRYPAPVGGFEAIAGHVAFYASRVDEASVDGELVHPQPGDFYGGWITANVSGPFKGGYGSSGW